MLTQVRNRLGGREIGHSGELLMNTRPLRRQIAGFVLVLLVAMATLWAQDAPKNPGPKSEGTGTTLKICVTSVMVNDQEKAFQFYTQTLGFVKKIDVPVGQDRWLTVVSPDEPNGTELLLEPTGFAPAKTYQKALFDAGIPLTLFSVADIQRTYEKMKKLGVVFHTPPTKKGPVTVAVFEDTCGNLIQLVQTAMVGPN
jgi:predicted enzyme related to lactoylglutathione lyase